MRIVLPTAAPGLVATFVYAFLFAWDELLFVAVAHQHNAETIPIGIRNFIGNYPGTYGAADGRRRRLDAPRAASPSSPPSAGSCKGITAGAVKG